MCFIFSLYRVGLNAFFETEGDSGGKGDMQLLFHMCPSYPRLQSAAPVGMVWQPRAAAPKMKFSWERDFYIWTQNREAEDFDV